MKVNSSALPGMRRASKDSGLRRIHNLWQHMFNMAPKKHGFPTVVCSPRAGATLFSSWGESQGLLHQGMTGPELPGSPYRSSPRGWCVPCSVLHMKPSVSLFQLDVLDVFVSYCEGLISVSFDHPSFPRQRSPAGLVIREKEQRALHCRSVQQVPSVTTQLHPSCRFSGSHSEAAVGSTATWCLWKMAESGRGTADFFWVPRARQYTMVAAGHIPCAKTRAATNLVRSGLPWACRDMGLHLVPWSTLQLLMAVNDLLNIPETVGFWDIHLWSCKDSLWGVPVLVAFLLHSAFVVTWVQYHLISNVQTYAAFFDQVGYSYHISGNSSYTHHIDTNATMNAVFRIFWNLKTYHWQYRTHTHPYVYIYSSLSLSGKI